MVFRPPRFRDPQFILVAVPLVLGWLPSAMIYSPTTAALQMGLRCAALPAFLLATPFSFFMVPVEEGKVRPRRLWFSAALYGLLAAACWTVFAGGAVTVLNVLPLGAPRATVVISGTVKSVDRFATDSGGAMSSSRRIFYCTVTLQSGVKLPISEAEYDRLHPGDAYKASAFMGRLGIPFLVRSSL